MLNNIFLLKPEYLSLLDMKLFVKFYENTIFEFEFINFKTFISGFIRKGGLAHNNEQINIDIVFFPPFLLSPITLAGKPTNKINRSHISKLIRIKFNLVLSSYRWNKLVMNKL